MMNLLATVGATLPILFGSGDSVAFYMAELGGSVVEQSSGLPVPSPVPVWIKLYSNGECIAGANVGLDGRYSVTASPGEYWVQILLGDEEAHAEKVTLTGGSWRKDFLVPSPVRSPSPPRVVSHQPDENSGIGGSGPVGQDDGSGLFNDAHRSGLLVPSMKPMPKWWEEYLGKPMQGPTDQARLGDASRPTSSPPKDFAGRKPQQADHSRD